jgi:peptide/nickel transport system permease protein
MIGAAVHLTLSSWVFMFSFVIKRLLTLIPIVVGVVCIVSLMIHLVPGDPIDRILGDFATSEAKDALRDQLGLNLSIPQQLLSFFNRLLHGDLGQSLIYNRTVTSLIFERFPATVELALCALFIALCIGIPLGTLSAVKKDSFQDHLAMMLSLLGIAIPNFWLGPMLILIFSIKLNLLPVSEKTGFASYILPSLTIGTALCAIISRMTRNTLLDALGEDYVRTAKAKGVHPAIILFKHTLRNAALPLVTIVGLQFGVLLTGAVVTEKIFDWPGLGTLMLDGLGNRDYPLVQGCVLVFSTLYLLVNLLTDIVYKIVDPRIKM